MTSRSILKILLLGTLCVPSAAAQKKFSRAVTDASLWDTIEATSSTECEGTPTECAVKMLAEQNVRIGDWPLFSVYRLGEMDGKSVTVVFVSHKVDGDDSVAGMLYRLELSLGDVEDRTFSLDELGRQYKCARGRTGWSKQICP